MVTTTRKYPRATVKKLLRGHTNKRISQNVDPLIYLDYVMFIHRLMENSLRKAKQAGEKQIAAKDIRKVTLTTLRQFKG